MSTLEDRFVRDSCEWIMTEAPSPAAVSRIIDTLQMQMDQREGDEDEQAAGVEQTAR